MIVKSFVGGHPLKIYRDCEYDPEIRKYRGGTLLCEIPYSGRMLSAVVRQENASPVYYGDTAVPTLTPQIFESADELPPESECDYCIVSALYAAACRVLGRDTSRLLTIGTPVVNEEGQTVGTVALNRN